MPSSVASYPWDLGTFGPLQDLDQSGPWRLYNRYWMGPSIGAVDAVVPARELIARLQREYAQARAKVAA